MTTLLDSIVAEEGAVPHLYLDVLGNITCGVGMLVVSPGHLGRFTWSDYVAAAHDFSMLSQMRRDASYGMKWPASRYAPLCRARMRDAREGLADYVADLHGALARRIPGFDAYPDAVQDALIDMGFNLGVDKLVKGYPKMLAALVIGDYETAARESHRKPPVSEARNQRTYDRIASANTSAGHKP